MVKRIAKTKGKEGGRKVVGGLIEVVAKNQLDKWFRQVVHFLVKVVPKYGMCHIRWQVVNVLIEFVPTGKREESKREVEKWGIEVVVEGEVGNCRGKL